ncbi:MAG: hypothetical protein JWQ52_1633 [Phenylobacterium sp.]|jgi:hypothetical protein|nr:hypothetical protein [Phenylobacterium sp.]
MRSLMLAAMLLLLTGCAGTFCRDDMHGLDGPDPGSQVPNPYSL